ncbi:MAG: glycosyltransferase [bacterium]
MTRPLLLHCFDGLGVGGAERSLVLLLRQLRGGTLEHAVCHLGPRRALVPEIEALGVPVHDLSSSRRRPLQSIVRLMRLIGRSRPALIHADHDYAKLCARVAARLSGTPLLVTVGNTVPPAPPTARTAAARRVRLFARAARVIGGGGAILAISQAVKDSLVARGVSPDRIVVVPRGLDLDDFRPDPPEKLGALRRSLGIDEGTPLLAHVGRLTTQKQQDVIIRALSIMTPAHPRVHLLLAGEGPERRAYQALAAAEGVADRVRFLGLRRDVTSLLQLAHLFVFPSIREGTGVALLEAMALSRACVASHIPALEEVLQSSGVGVLVPPRRPDLLAEAVSALLADPARRVEMGRRARLVVEQRYDIRRSAAQFEEVAHRVIGAARRGDVRPVGAEVR